MAGSLGFVVERKADNNPDSQNNSLVHDKEPVECEVIDNTPNDNATQKTVSDMSEPQKKKVRSYHKFKHASSFNCEWKTGRPWLMHVDGLVMYCSLCRKYNKMPFDRGTWNKTPCKRMRLESVEDHEDGDSHKDAVRREQGATVVVAKIDKQYNLGAYEACLFHFKKI
jgi:hypothetical protein